MNLTEAITKVVDYLQDERQDYIDSPRPDHSEMGAVQ